MVLPNIGAAPRIRKVMFRQLHETTESACSFGSGDHDQIRPRNPFCYPKPLGGPKRR